MPNRSWTSGGNRTFALEKLTISDKAIRNCIADIRSFCQEYNYLILQAVIAQYEMKQQSAMTTDSTKSVIQFCIGGLTKEAKAKLPKHATLRKQVERARKKTKVDVFPGKHYFTNFLKKQAFLECSFVFTQLGVTVF